MPGPAPYLPGYKFNWNTKQYEPVSPNPPPIAAQASFGPIAPTVAVATPPQTVMPTQPTPNPGIVIGANPPTLAAPQSAKPQGPGAPSFARPPRPTDGNYTWSNSENRWIPVPTATSYHPTAGIGALPVRQYPGGTPNFNEQLTAHPATQETLIPNQLPDNPISNAFAMARAAGAEYAPRHITAQDVAADAHGFGLDGYLNTQALGDQAVSLSNAIADQAYYKADQDFRNRYGGLGVSGNRIARASELAQQYALSKGQAAQDIRERMNNLGFARQLNLLDRSTQLLGQDQNLQENRFHTLLDTGLRQNELQTGLVQRERDREANRQDLVTRLTHDTATQEAANNAQARGAFTSALMNMIGDMAASGGGEDLGAPANLGQSLLNPFANLAREIPQLLPLLSAYLEARR